MVAGAQCVVDALDAPVEVLVDEHGVPLHFSRAAVEAHTDYRFRLVPARLGR